MSGLATTTYDRLAWIGLGNMGRGMAKNLISKGNLKQPLVLQNRTHSTAEQLAKELEPSAVAAKSVEEAVKSADVIFTCLINDAALRDTIEQALEVDVTGKIFVDATTVHPDTTNALVTKISARGGQLVSMTVLGSPDMAATGSLISIVAGPLRAIEVVKPYTEGVTSRQTIVFQDESAGKADLIKLIANTFIINVNEVVAEGLTFAEKTDVDPRKLQELLNALFGPTYHLYSQRMLSGAYHAKKPQVPIDMVLKDAHHAQKIAKDVGASLPALDLAETHLQTVKSETDSQGDSSAVYGVLRKASGLPWNNQP